MAMDAFIDKRRQDELLKAAEQAAAWAISADKELGSQERAQFAAWLEESPLHVELFLRATAVNQIGDMLTPQTRSRLEAAMQTPVHADAGIVPLQTGGLPPDSPTQYWKRKGPAGWSVGIAAACAALVAALWLYGSGTFLWERYTTAVGEQRSVTLSDGSVLYLNSDSKVLVRLRRGVREVRLGAGEAMFKVAHDTARPFRVYVDDAVVEAVGTQFDIYRQPTQTTVAVVEGIVQVSERPDERRSAPRLADDPTRRVEPDEPAQLPASKRLLAGQAVQLNLNGKMSKPLPINVAQVTAWRQRRLVFEWERLETIVAEFNRYNRLQLSVEDATARARRYTAVFDANEPQALLRFLSKEHDLEFDRQGDVLIIRHKANPAPQNSSSFSADAL